MKKQLLLFVMMVLPLVASAITAEIDGINYNLVSKLKTAEVISSINFSNFTHNYVGSITIPESVTYNDEVYNVTSIGERAFSYCDALTSVVMGNNITNIGERAFECCSALVSVTIGNSVTSIGGEAFLDCTGLEKVIAPNIAGWCNINFTDDSSNPLFYAKHLYSDENTEITNLIIPNSVTSIGDYTFLNCSGLTSVIIPNSVTSIGFDAFYKCSGLTSLTFPNSMISIEGGAFYGCDGLEKVIILNIEGWCNNNFTDVYSNPLFYAKHLYSDENTEITNLIIPNSVTSIGDYTFLNCSGLTSVIIPNSVTSIGFDAFENCSGLTSVTIGDNVTSIGNSAFSGCSGLTSVTIGNSVTTIGNNAFESCIGLTSVTIPNSVTSIGIDAFVWCSGLTSVTIGNSVTSIGIYAFWGCSGLTSVTIPNSVINIEGGAFQDCSSLTSVTIPNSVTSIGWCAFQGCSNITSVTIGNSIQNIGSLAFGDCPELVDVTCYAESMPNTDTDSFKDSYIELATLHVPASSISLYQTAEPWSSFGTIKVIEYESPGNENGDGYWSTYYNSMGNFEADDNTKVYTASLDELQEKLVLTEVTDKIIKAGQGVILKSTSANANLAYTSAEGTEGFYTNNALKGFDEATTTTAVEGTIYVLGENSSKELGFYKYSGTTLNANKAYLEINASSARQFYSIGDNTTDISRIMNAPKTTEQIFNLQGQQVAHPSKGAYIVNGHKVIIK